MPMHITSEQGQRLAYTRWGVQLKVMGEELHGACPFCRISEEDGFWISLQAEYNGHYQCRNCRARGWLDDDKPFHADKVSLVDWQARMAAKAQQDQRDIEMWRAGFNSARVLALHDQLIEHPQTTQWLLDEGVREESIARYVIGFTPRKKVRDGAEFPAYIFPIMSPTDGELVNINYRLLNAPPSYGKYRFVYGIPTANHFANSVLEGTAIVVEGTKKGIVLNQAQEDELDGKADTGIVAVPSNTPDKRLLQQIAEFYNRVYFFLDPGSDAALARIGKVLANTPLKGRAYYVKLPTKPDDMIVKYGMAFPDLRKYIKYYARTF